MKLIILDRDGVINYDSDAYIKSPDEWIAIPGSMEAICLLTKANYTIAVCTNQSAVGRGIITLEQLSRIHEKMQKTVHDAGGKISAISFCPHTPYDNCKCRKHQTQLHF
jgi:D-glycero-D-manno-heptose 1,7-bisphosphate phosphatase